LYLFSFIYIENIHRMSSTSPLRLCYEGKNLPSKGVKPLIVHWDPSEADVVAVAFDNGSFAMWKYGSSVHKVYSLQQAAMAVPTYSTDADPAQSLPDSYGVTKPRVLAGQWLDFQFTSVGDQRELFFSFKNSNKVLRTHLSMGSAVDVGGYVTGSPVFEFAAHKEPVTALAPTPYRPNNVSEAMVLTGSEDGSVILWDAGLECGDDLREIGERTIHVIRAHAGAVRAVCFAGDYYVSSGMDEAIRVWRLADGVQACYFPSEKTIISRISCGPVFAAEEEGTVMMIAAGSDQGGVFLWRMSQDFSDEAEAQEGTPSIRLVGLADHTQSEISSISMYPVKSRYGESDGVGVISGNQDGGIHVYKFGRARHLAHVFDGETVLDENDTLPAHAFELQHEARYKGGIVSGEARYELSLGRVPSSDEVVLALVASSEGDVDVLRVPSAGHNTSAEAQVDDDEGMLSLLVTLREPEEEEGESVENEESKEERGRDTNPVASLSPKRRESTEATTPSKSRESPPASSRRRSPFGAPIAFGEGFETVLKIERYEERDTQDVPEADAPEPEPHPMVVYNQIGMPAEDDSQKADKWAADQFGGGGDKPKGQVIEPAGPSKKIGRKTGRRANPGRKPGERVHGPRISRKFLNKERAHALLEVEKAHRPNFKANPDSPLQNQRLGFQGSDPPYFTGAEFPISDLQEPVLNSTAGVRDAMKKLSKAKFDRIKVEDNIDIKVDPSLDVPYAKPKYVGLVPVQMPVVAKKRTVSKQISAKWAKEVADTKKPNIFDAPGLREMQFVESTLQDVDFYCPPQAVLSFDEVNNSDARRWENAGFMSMDMDF
jgi:WD40 repeat protein